jgi:hypothetical protein
MQEFSKADTLEQVDAKHIYSRLLNFSRYAKAFAWLNHPTTRQLSSLKALVLLFVTSSHLF